MDYKKEYEKLKADIKKAYFFAQTDSTKAVLEHILPELADSEDERIRKELVKETRGSEERLFETVTNEEFIAWLEKQEQKPATIDIDRMIDDYANNKERGNEVFGKPVPCMVRAYRQGLNEAIGKVVLKPAEWSEDYTERMGQIINYLKCQAKEELTRSRTLLGWVALLKSIFRKGLPEIQIPCTEAARKGIHRIMDVFDWAADKGRISDSDCEDYMILLSAYIPQPKQEWSEEDEKRIKNEESS